MAESKEVVASSETFEGPQLEVINRMKNIPVIHSAIEKTGSTYSYVKDSHHLINWALSYAEAGFHYATATAAPLTAPWAKKFEGEISAVDQTLCKGLDIVEEKMPIVKQPPQQIYDAAKAVMSSSLQPTIEKLQTAKTSASQQASSLRETSIAKANELLNLPYGDMAVQGVDSTSALIDQLIDRYFPPVDGIQELPRAPVSADENKVLHAVQTIGLLSGKMADRVYSSIAAQLRTIKKEDVAAYMNSVVSILHLTHSLKLADKEENDKKGTSSPSEEQPRKE